jgi:hypothetical protein
MNDQPQRSDSTEPGASDQPGNAQAPRTPMSPGDEAPEGTPGTGEDVCPNCGGTGNSGGRPCSVCQGTGRVIVGIGGA